MQTTLTAEGTATRGFVKCFWASKNPSAELCKWNYQERKLEVTLIYLTISGLSRLTHPVKVQYTNGIHDLQDVRDQMNLFNLDKLLVKSVWKY